MLATSTARAAPPATTTADLSSRSNRYFDEEDFYNTAYVVVGAAMTTGGIFAAAQDDDAGVRAFGIPLIAVGAIELAVGAIYLGLTPGLRSDADAQLARGPGAFLDAERPRVRSLEGNFVYYKIVEGVVAGAGLGLIVAGAAADHEALRGVGAGLLTAGFVQLQLEHLTHDVARRHLEALDAFTIVPTTRGALVMHGGRF